MKNFYNFWIFLLNFFPDITTYHLPFLYSCVSFIGVLLLLGESLTFLFDLTFTFLFLIGSLDVGNNFLDICQILWMVFLRFEYAFLVQTFFVEQVIGFRTIQPGTEIFLIELVKNKVAIDDGLEKGLKGFSKNRSGFLTFWLTRFWLKNLKVPIESYLVSWAKVWYKITHDYYTRSDYLWPDQSLCCTCSLPSHILHSGMLDYPSLRKKQKRFIKLIFLNFPD